MTKIKYQPMLTTEYTENLLKRFTTPESPSRDSNVDTPVPARAVRNGRKYQVRMRHTRRSPEAAHYKPIEFTERIQKLLNRFTEE